MYPSAAEWSNIVKHNFKCQLCSVVNISKLKCCCPNVFQYKSFHDTSREEFPAVECRNVKAVRLLFHCIVKLLSFLCCRWGSGSLRQLKEMSDEAERQDDGGRGKSLNNITPMFQVSLLCMKCRVNVYCEKIIVLIVLFSCSNRQLFWMSCIYPWLQQFLAISRTQTILE